MGHRRSLDPDSFCMCCHVCNHSNLDLRPEVLRVLVLEWQRWTLYSMMQESVVWGLVGGPKSDVRSYIGAVLVDVHIHGEQLRQHLSEYFARLAQGGIKDYVFRRESLSLRAAGESLIKVLIFKVKECA